MFYEHRVTNKICSLSLIESLGNKTPLTMTQAIYKPPKSSNRKGNYKLKNLNYHKDQYLI